MFINHKHKFIFIHIPKNAGTSIRNSFDIQGYDKKVIRKPYPHNSCSEIKTYCGDLVWETFYKFAVTRNPYERMVSYYHFHKSPQYRYPARANTLSFNDWIFKGLDGNMKKNQTWCLDEDVNYIGRYEDLQDDFNIVCANIGIEPYILPKFNVSEHNEWKSYYTDDSEKLVNRIFQDDFEVFNYDYI